MRASERAWYWGLRISCIFITFFLFLSYVSCNRNNEPNNYNEKKEKRENNIHKEAQKPIQTHSEPALNPLFVPEGSGIILCNGPFALCSAALCEIDANDPSKATCTCPVLTGPSVGDSDEMEKFRPEGETSCTAPPAPYRIWSFFKPRNEIPQAPDFESKPALGMTCPEGKYVNCFGFPCEWDGKSSRATCYCEVATGAFGTQVGNCDRKNCRQSPLGIPSGFPLDDPPFTSITQSCPSQKQAP
jgi:hypothetical protein